MYEDLKGKVVVVTGAGSGLGQATVLQLVKEGAKVVAVTRRQERLNGTLALVAELGGEVTGFLSDAANKESQIAAIDKAIEVYGKVDVLVNSAGIADDFSPLDLTTDEEWESTYTTNVDGTFYITRRAVQVMKEQGHGNIVNISSDCGLFGGRSGISYTSSKWVVVGMTKNIAYLNAFDGIRCNCVCPGGIPTNFGENSKFIPAGFDRIKLGFGTVPGQGTKEEIASLITFLCSDASSILNGAIIQADKGWGAY